MINGYEIYCCVFTTNLVKNKYFPVSHKAMESWNKFDFVDKIYAFNGDSTDDTVEKHSDIEKVNFITSPKWNTEEISQDVMVKQYEFCLDFFNNLNRKCIVFILSSDNIWSEKLGFEILQKTKNLIKSNQYNFFNLPFVKVPTKDVREIKRNFSSFSIYSAIKFNEEIKWNKIANEIKLSGSQKAKGLVSLWENQMFSYETWFFTKEDILRKIKIHKEWDEKLSIDDTMKKAYLKKLKMYGKRDMSYSEHPKEAQELIDILEEDHLGYSLFGNYIKS